ncbi:hypothetical protein B0H14DRAFT_3863697 [Mycena olivaceomarginata]|nr:hypothetical protein B0H14DRAFT_3863697 [Mycena olivaceomarginata]
MFSKIDVLKARLVIAQANQQKNTSKKSKKDKENASPPARGNGKAAKKEKRNAPTVEWAKKEFFPMTDALLTLPAIQADVAEELFIKDKPDAKYTADDLPELAKVVKNRVAALKTAYSKNRGKLGETGHGLVTESKKDDITEDSVIANAWDAIEKKFPWYMRMHDLMGASPVVNRSAVAHSGTRVDLGILDRRGEAHNGPILSIDSDDESKFSGWGPSSPVNPDLDADTDDHEDNVPATPKAKVKDEPRSTPFPSARGSKRKSVHDHIQDLTTHNHAKQLKLALRSKAKYDAQNSLELARLEHQQKEAERQREHELLMFDRRMRLEEMRRAASAPTVGMYRGGAPAYGAAPLNFPLDPAQGNIDVVQQQRYQRCNGAVQR